MPNNWSSQYTFPLLTSSGASTGVNVDLNDMFVRKELFIDANLWGWGRGDLGALGNNVATSVSTPIQIGTLTTWKMISPGASHLAIALQTNGTLWASGQNIYGIRY